MKSTFRLSQIAIMAMCAAGTVALAQTQPPANPASAPRAARGAPAPGPAPGAAPNTASSNTLRPCTSVTTDPPILLTMGKSQVLHLPYPATRIVVGGQASSRAGRPVGPPAASAPPGGAPPAAPPPSMGTEAPGVADAEFTLLSPTDLFLLGRRTGAMNMIIQGADGRCAVKDIIVTVDPNTLQAKLGELMPGETGVKVSGAENAIVLTGSVSDSVKLDQVLTLAAAYGDPKKVVNLMRVNSPQQVMLEVKIAEVSKNLLNKLGANINVQRSASSGLNTYTLLSDFLSGGNALLQALRIGTGTLTIDAQKDDGLVRILAEPNIMSVSGQSASFLSGGKIFIPVSQSSTGTAFPVITLEEKEFGIGLKFTPTVLDGRVNLKVTTEVSELAQTGSPFTTVNGVTAILPSLTTRRVDTTVQLGDGQTFAVAGLIKNNFAEAMKKFPGLGDTPIVGALFRSTEFQNEQSELLFVVTPRLVKPIIGPVKLPTDVHVPPTSNDAFFSGKAEGSRPPPPPPPPPAPPPSAPPARTSGLLTPPAKAEPVAQPVKAEPIAQPAKAEPMAPIAQTGPVIEPTRLEATALPASAETVAAMRPAPADTTVRVLQPEPNTPPSAAN